MSGTGGGFVVQRGRGRGCGGGDEVDDLMQRMRLQLNLEAKETAAGVKSASPYAYESVEDQLLADRFLKLKKAEGAAAAAGSDAELEQRFSRLQASASEASAATAAVDPLDKDIAAWIAAAEEEEEEVDIGGAELEQSSLWDRMLYMRQVLDLRLEGLELPQLMDKASLLFAKRVLCDVEVPEALAVESTLAMLCDDAAFEKHFFGLPQERQSLATMEDLRAAVLAYTENAAKP